MIGATSLLKVRVPFECGVYSWTFACAAEAWRNKRMAEPTPINAAASNTKVGTSDFGRAREGLGRRLISLLNITTHCRCLRDGGSLSHEDRLQNIRQLVSRSFHPLFPEIGE